MNNRAFLAHSERKRVSFAAAFGTSIVQVRDSVPSGCVNKIAMIDHTELLRSYTQDEDHDAFRELVRRHLNLVYSYAGREVTAMCTWRRM